ncbi:MAG TPA: hypothetical protein VMD30_00760, partial [Tepidisphaeraceae bacterium]|nr:hypothetical protein [Tepidisphaeraceae bacterium]
MILWLLNLFGIHLDSSANLVDWSIIPRGTVPMPWLLIAAIVLALLVFWRYQHAGSHVSPRRKIVLASLRTLLLLSLLCLLARPIVRLTVEGSVRRNLIVLVDRSQSMNIVDVRTDGMDQKRESIMTGNTDPISRLELVKAALKNRDLDLLGRIGRLVDVEPIGFGRNIAPLSGGSEWIDNLTAPEDATAIGDALRQSLSRSRGQPLAGIWVITDGQSNTGSAMATVAEQLKQAGVPVYAWGVGITTPRDVAVTDVLAPDICFLGDPVPVSVRVRTTGMNGRAARLTLKLNDRQVDAVNVKFDPSGEQLVSVKFTPSAVGKFTLAARIPPLVDEVNKDNNQATHVVTVINKKIKVLYVEQSPRWEYKYLSALLNADSKRLDPNFLLLDADPGITQGNPAFLSKFPDRQDLLQYDLLILGDVDPRTFTADDLTNISDFVSHFGGSVITIAGRRFMPSAYAGTPIDDLLPIDILRDAPAAPIEEEDDTPIELELAPG